MDMKLLIQVATILVVVGALNWLAVGTADKNVVNRLVGNTDGSMSGLERGVYVVVGIAALVVVYDLMVHRHASHPPHVF